MVQIERICTTLFALLRSHVATPPTVYNDPPIDTPFKSTSSSQRADEQTHDDLDERILQEINGRVYKDTEGFEGKCFEGKPWSKEAQQIVDEMNPRVVGGRWTGYPERPSQDAFLDWLFGLQSQFIANRRSTYHASPDLPLAGSECKRKPDIFLAHFDASKDERHHNWAEVQVIGELKQSKIRGMDTAELLKFCGNACELFASQPTRRFLHGFIIRGSYMELWVFDRSGLSAASSSTFIMIRIASSRLWSATLSCLMRSLV